MTAHNKHDKTSTRVSALRLPPLKMGGMIGMGSGASVMFRGKVDEQTMIGVSHSDCIVS